MDHTGHELMFRNRFWVCLVLTVPVLLYSSTVQGWLGFTMPTFSGSTLVTPVFAVVVFLYGGVPFLQMAPAELRQRQPGMMTLISMAISVAFVYSLLAFSLDLGEGFFWELVTLIDVMLLGHWIEMRSIRQASGALNELAKLMPDKAERIAADGGTQMVPVGELQLDDTVLVRPGANVAADGTVIEGESEVNEALLTGESSPVRKTAGAGVIAGAINGAGSLRVRVTAIGDRTALAGIMRLVAEAEKSRSRVQVLADSAAGWLFYGAITIAALTAVVWVVAVGFEGDVVKRAVTVLVIACPHALGLAIPLVVAISTAKAADNGVLVRNRLALEAARSVDFVIFDKTGTLTKGEQGVAAIAAFDGLSDDRALALTSAIEGDSPIPYWMDGAADVAETTYTPFQAEPDAAPVRLIVRRVKPAPGSQLALFATYSYHGFITDRDGETLELEADHRRHAEIENAIRDLKYGVGLNHLPSGRFAANGAWLAVQVMAHNLARWTARIGLGQQIVTTKTLRRRVFALAGRITRSARRLTLHLPRRWPWEEQFSRALARLRAIPLPA